MKVKINNLSWGVEEKKIINTLSLKVNKGKIIGVVGPNGSGKSSLLRLVYRYHKPDSGLIYLNKQNIADMNYQESARHLAVVPQERSAAFGYSVFEMVKLGRNPHKKMMDSDTPEDMKIIQDSLEKVGMQNLARRDFNTLSGGEKQRVLIARALAQRAKVLILDEPTNSLDIRYQFEIMELIKSLSLTTLTTMHDLNLAATYCDQIYLLKKGKVVARGKPGKILTPDLIRSVYGVKVNVKVSREGGRVSILFFR